MASMKNKLFIRVKRFVTIHFQHNRMLKEFVLRAVKNNLDCINYFLYQGNKIIVKYPHIVYGLKKLWIL